MSEEPIAVKEAIKRCNQEIDLSFANKIEQLRLAFEEDSLDE